MRVIFPTPHQAAAIYDCLREFPPFRQWKLPPAEEVTFTVNLAEGHAGQYWRSGGTHHIDVSAKCMSHFNTFVEVMAHEMIHLYQNMKGTENKALHNAEFKRLSAAMCGKMGWDSRRYC